MDTDNLLNICRQAIDIVSDAATFIKSQHGKLQTSDIIVKGHNSLVSYVDMEAEKILVKGLSEILPKAGFITEEEMVKQEMKQYTWIIDPLDGTTNFIHSIPYFSVSVALYDGEEIIVGIVHDVMHDEVFYAIKNQGAFLNEQKISVSINQKFKDILIGTGFPYKADETKKSHMTSLYEVLVNTRGIRRCGSAALDLCQVGCGRFGAFYECNLNSYDIAAGALIVKEAGGLVSDFRGDQNWLFEGEILASAPQFKDNMLDILSCFTEE